MTASDFASALRAAKRADAGAGVTTVTNWEVRRCRKRTRTKPWSCYELLIGRAVRGVLRMAVLFSSSFWGGQLMRTVSGVYAMVFLDNT